MAYLGGGFHTSLSFFILTYLRAHSPLPRLLTAFFFIPLVLCNPWNSINLTKDPRAHRNKCKIPEVTCLTAPVDVVHLLNVHLQRHNLNLGKT